MDKYYLTKIINVPLYPFKLVIILSNDTERIKKQLPIIEEEEIFAHAIKGYINLKNYSHLAVFSVFNFNYSGEDKITYGIICHEVSHLTGYIAEKVGLSNEFASEHIAYLQGWIANEIFKFIINSKFTIHTK